MDRCPNCKARYRQGDSCRRCGMDLLWLLKIDTRAEGIKRAIIHCLINAEYDQARNLVEQHQRLVQDSFIRRVGAFLKAQQKNGHLGTSE